MLNSPFVNSVSKTVTIDAVLSAVPRLGKQFKFQATPVSRAMDRAYGGVKKFGRYHRTMGGHSIADIKMWRKYKLKYAKELAKDFITPEGLPLLGIQTARRMKLVSAKTASRWGSAHVGHFFGFIAATRETYSNIRTFQQDPEEFLHGSASIVMSGGYKILSGAVAWELMSILSGVCDIGLVTYAQVDSALTFDCSPTAFGHIKS